MGKFKMDQKEENFVKINQKYSEIDLIYSKLLVQTSSLSYSLKNEKSYEYITHGVGRRLLVINRCIHNIFSIFPVTKTDVLPKEGVVDLDINLHAFFVNVSGIIDNLAWFFVLENNLFDNDPSFSQQDVSLFKKKTQKYLNPGFVSYLKGKDIKKWYIKHSKDFRDALAHRIPLYVPPFMVSKEEQEKYLKLEEQLFDFSLEGIANHDKIREEQKGLGKACPFYVHSLSESRTMYLHAQVIADYITIEEIVNKFCLYFKQI